MNESIKPPYSLVLFATLFLMMGFLAACGNDLATVTVIAERPSETPTATNVPTNTTTPIPTNAPSHTPTFTPLPTETKIPTNTPFPTVTSFPTVTAMPTIQTKTVFLEYRSDGGDGGSDTDLYYGRGMPYLVIYTDGQVIIGEFGENDRYFLESSISPDGMCDLLAQLTNSGFFETYDPIYAFDETTQFSDGAPYVTMLINGPMTQQWEFYGPYRDYLIPPLKQSYELFKNYRPVSDTYYMPERLILWIEMDTDSSESTDIASWPDTLPPISQLWQDPINHEVLVEGDAVAPIMALFDYRLTSKSFMDEGVQYDIILRPLLPNETPYPDLWYYGTHSQTFNLPFDCPNIDLLPIVPTATAVVPSVEGEPIPDLVGKGYLLLTSKQNGNSDVYIINADGTNMLNLTNHLAKDEMAVMSPDGQKIAFVSNRDGNEELYLMNPDGTDVTRLTYTPDRDLAPAWSPDSKQVIFMSNRLGDWRDEKWQLFVVNLETGVESQFTDTLIAEGMYAPDWSSEGDHVLFSSGRPDALQIFVMDENGENKEALGTGTGAVWSPDGQHIAFLDKGLTDRHQIFMMNADGTQRQQLTHLDSYLSGIAWSPDGKYIVYTPYLSGKPFVYLMNVADGTEPVLLRHDAEASDWLP